MTLRNALLLHVAALTCGALFAGCSGGSSGGGGGASSQTTLPIAPSNLEVVPAATSIELTWSDSSHNEAGFWVERRIAGVGSFTVIASYGIGVEAHSDITVQPGESYDYRISSHNAAGSNPSPVVAGTALGGEETGGSTTPGPTTPPLLNVTVNLQVGIGISGFAGDGGLALNAQVNGLEGLALDASGNLLLADTLNNRIRRVNRLTGIVSTLGGTGTASFSGDGGAATSATFSGPTDLAVDARGNVYVADTGNNRVRRIDTSGQVTTLAGTGTAGFSGDGGLAASAELNSPRGVALDLAGNLFVADTLNQRIRRIDAQTGVITTVAGDGTLGFSGDGGAATSASLSGPLDIALDATGRLYIADFGNDRVRRVDNLGVITTLAGTGSAGFSGDGGAATSAELNGPAGLALDRLGNLYVADRANNRIRKLTAATGVLSTVGGTGSASYSGDGGLAVQADLQGPGRLALDSAGRLIFADTGNNRVRVLARLEDLTITTTSLAAVALGRPIQRVLQATGGTGLGYTWSLIGGTLPTGLSLNSGSPGATLTGTASAGASTNLTFRVTDSGGAQATVAIPLLAGAPSIVTSAGSGVAGFSGDGGAATSATLGLNAAGIAVTSAGDIVFADTANNRIRKITTSTGVISTIAGSGAAGFSGDGGAATSATLNGPQDVSVDLAGNVFIADTDNNRIRRVDARTQVITTVAGTGAAGFSGDGGVATSAALNGPRSVSVGKSGDLFVADTGNRRVRRVQALTGRITTYAGTGLSGLLSALGDGLAAILGVLNRPVALDLDADDNLFIVDQLSFRVRRVDRGTGVITTVAGSGLLAGFGGDGGLATLATLNFPSDVAVDAAGNLFIADRSNHRLRQITSGGVISTICGDGVGAFLGDGGLAASARVDAPTSVAVGQGSLQLLDQTNLRVRTVRTQ